jgi:hypothetical protein
MTHPLFVFSAAFESHTRADGSVFWTTKDGAPQWVSDLVHAAHCDALPCDWRYGKITDLAHDFGDLSTFAGFNLEQWADGAGDVYTHDLLQWVSRVSWAVDAIDSAASDWGTNDENFVQQIMTGQRYMLEELARAVVSALQEQIDEALAQAEELAAAV